MKRLQNSCKQRRGAALLTSLILVGGIASLGAGLVQMSSVSTRQQNLSLDTAHAVYVTEAALSEAYFAVAQGRSGAIGTETEPAQLAGGYYWVESTDLGNNIVALQAVGMFGRGRFSLGMTLNKSVNQVAQLGLCGLDGVNVGEGSVLRSVNSNGENEDMLRGVVGAIFPDPVNVRSNGDITIYSPPALLGIGATQVKGNVRPGPNGIVDSDPSTVITGSTSSSARGLSLPNFTVPKFGTPTSGLNFPSGSSTVTLNADSAYENVNVPSGKTLVLEGPMRIRSEHLFVGSGAQVVIDTTNGPVGIYTTGVTDFESGSILQNIGDDPTQCSLFALSTVRTEKAVVNMGAKGEFKGMIIAPRSTVNIPGNLQVTGSIVGETLNIGNNATVEFAEDLRESGFGVKMTPTMVSWEILEVPDSPLTRGSAPIRATLRLLGLTTRASSNAAPESDVRMNYTDNFGVAFVYDGPINLAPWGSVDSMSDMDWYLGGLLQGPTRPSIVSDAIDDKRGNVDLVPFL